MDTAYTTIIGTTKAETDLAVLIEFADSEEWFPKSQLEEWPDIDEEGDVVLPEWLAIDRELE